MASVADDNPVTIEESDPDDLRGIPPERPPLDPTGAARRIEDNFVFSHGQLRNLIAMPPLNREAGRVLFMTSVKHRLLRSEFIRRMSVLIIRERRR